MKLLITGAGGLVGRAFSGHATAKGDQVIAVDHAALDIANETAVNDLVARERPDAVINCAAWTDVDGCESDPAHATNANARGPEVLAQACRQADALLITISTDYVFNGDKEGFYTQRDQPDPKSVYGQSKLDGEHRAQGAWARTVVVRSGYIFGPGGKNFLSTFMTRALRGESLTVINDSFGTPTYAHDLAARLYLLTQRDLPGIYHIVNSGNGASFADFARVAFSAAKLDPELLNAVSMDSLKRPAPRPRNSRLRCLLSEAIGLEPMPVWRDAVARFVAPQ